MCRCSKRLLNRREYVVSYFYDVFCFCMKICLWVNWLGQNKRSIKNTEYSVRVSSELLEWQSLFGRIAQGREKTL